MTAPDQRIADLLRRIKADDDARGALGELTELLRAWLVRLCARLASNSTDAEDFAQDTWWRAWEKRHQFRGTTGAEFRRWVSTIAANLVRRSMGRARLPTVPLGEHGVDPRTGPDVTTERPEVADTADLLRRVIEGIVDPRWREAFWMIQIEGLTPRQIAERFRVSPATVRRWLAKVIERIREQIGGEA